MDGAQAWYLYFAHLLLGGVGRRGGREEVWVWTQMEPPLVQILVVVANIQMRTLKTEVGKGSMSTADEHGLVDPNL